MASIALHSASPMQLGCSMIEAKLSGDVPFGSHQYLSRNLTGTYTKFLEFLALRSLAARQLLATLQGPDIQAQNLVFRDVLLRRTIEDGVCLFAEGIATIEPAMLDELLAVAATHAAAPSRTLLNESAQCVSLRPAGHPGYVWADEHSKSMPAQRFRTEVMKRLPGFQLLVPTNHQISVLAAGAELSHRIAPTLTESALNHAFMIVIGSFPSGEKFKSATLPGLPGVIILSPEATLDVFDAAQTLLHEAVHLKFLDIDYVHPLFAPGFRQETSRRVTPAWHEGKAGYGNWPVDRLLTSMHVYLSMAVFLEKARAVGHEALPADQDLAAEAAKSRERAAWLLNEAYDHLDALSSSGRDFVAFNAALLGNLNVVH